MYVNYSNYTEILKITRNSFASYVHTYALVNGFVNMVLVFSLFIVGLVDSQVHFLFFPIAYYCIMQLVCHWYEEWDMGMGLTVPWITGSIVNVILHTPF